ncbi:MAG: hypothetical protein IPM54_24745 [Polyangiaceae bacterium]|nr:hypothetical protein [Polyangiaceae bacterium]
MLPLPADDAVLPTVQQFLVLFSNALTALGASPKPHELERPVFVVHEALAGQAREFHSHEHVLTVTHGASPIETLAGIFHDVVYVQVDRGFPGAIGELLRPFLTPVDGAGYRVSLAILEDPVTAMVARIFDRAPGDELSPFAGLNELASALVATKCLAPLLSKSQLARIAAGIEATIPFRDNNTLEALAARLRDLSLPDLDAAACEDAVRVATRLGNRDVENFAEEDPARFLDNTWRLLPETNPALAAPGVYRTGEYRMAIQKMEAFLSKLDAERVFHVYRGEPSPEEHARRISQAKRNIDLAVRYLRAKLYTIALVEAIAHVSGGDAPIEFFLGAIPVPGSPVRSVNAELYLPKVAKSSDDMDPVMLRLLEEGRPTPPEFDLPASPYTAYLYRVLGEKALMERMEASRPWMRGRITAQEYLASQASPPVAALARAIAPVAITRREVLEKLAGELA